MGTCVKFFPFYVYVGAKINVIRSWEEWKEFQENCGVDTEKLKNFCRIRCGGGDFIFGIGLNHDREITLHEWDKKKNLGLFP